GRAARLRRELEARLGPEWAPFVAILGGVRAALAGDPARTEVVRKLLASPLLELVRQGRSQEVDALLAREAGAGCTLVRLGVALGGEGWGMELGWLRLAVALCLGGTLAALVGSAVRRARRRPRLPPLR